jgi:hypothetical protein
MSLISCFVHYTILRNMCDPKINEPNNKEIITTKTEKHDIEMGLKDKIVNVNYQKQVKKDVDIHPDYWWV